MLAEHEFMPENAFNTAWIYLQWFGSFNKNKERTKKFKETEDSKYIYQNKLDKSCFQHDMAYKDIKVLPWKIAWDISII